MKEKKGFNFREWLISSTYKTPFINFIFSTKDFITPKFIDYEFFRTNQSQLNKKYIYKEILDNKQHIMAVMDKKEKIKYNLLDVAKSFNQTFKYNKDRKDNLLIIVDDSKDYFEIIFINTLELYEESSYKKKHFNKNNKFFENNMNNLSFLFAYYSLVTNGISVISKKKIDFLKSHNVYYLTLKEQKDIFKRTIPFERISTKLFRYFIMIFLFLLPLITSTYLFFNYRLETKKNIINTNKNYTFQINKMKRDIKKLNLKKQELFKIIKDKRIRYKKDLK